MKKNIPTNEYIQFVMEQMNLKQADLVKYGCASRSHTSEFVNGVRKPSIFFVRKFLKLTKRYNSAVSWQILTS